MDASDALRLVARLEQDRVGQLPDSILRLIFAYLTTRDAVRSSVLSKRWRNLWASMQRLDFDSHGFKGSLDFSRFVDTVLVLRDQLDVHEFRLIWYYDDYDEDHANMWIRYAVKHNVRVLHLEIFASDENDCIRLPDCFFTCQSFEALHVSISPVADTCYTRLSGFSRIKTLDLEFLTLDDNLEKLLSGCPVIEDLRLCVCSFNSDSDSNVDIISQTLKSLWIEGCDFHGKVTRISIPSLRTLHYANTTGIGKTSLDNLSSLVYAFISDNTFNEYETHSSAIKIIKGLSNAKSLELYGLWTEFVNEEELSEFPTFWNLRSLKMGKWCLSDNFQPVAFFLRNSPNLEKLTLKQSSLWRSQFLYKVTVNKESDKLSFNCPRLKIIEIQCGKSKERVPELVGILLENSRISHSIMINP